MPSNRSPIVACTRVAGMRLPSRCLAMGIHVIIWSTSGFESEEIGRLKGSRLVQFRDAHHSLYEESYCEIPIMRTFIMMHIPLAWLGIPTGTRFVRNPCRTKTSTCERKRKEMKATSPSPPFTLHWCASWTRRSCWASNVHSVIYVRCFYV
jgi:hypothetical protein